MTDVDIAGVGIWSEYFSGWDEFCSVLAGGASPEATALKPELIPAKERRRAPLSVKMAVEVMDQACRMAGLEPTTVATVFASVYGDIQITDYMCNTLHAEPRTISPTRFHNSVHNAATGYWSIATQSHSPANAISAYRYSASMAILEGAIQAVEEGIPVVVAMQELAAPTAFKPFYESEQVFSTAFVLTPPGFHPSPAASVRLHVSNVGCEYPDLPGIPGVDWSDNFAAKLLSLLAALATVGEAELRMPISSDSSISLAVDVKQDFRNADV